MRGPRTNTAVHKKLDSEMLKKGKGEIKMSKGKTSKKDSKDPHAPKRPLSAYILFMQDFRNSFKENHLDNISIMAMSKAGGDKWKTMSISEKAPYVAKAAKKKAEYEIALEAYKKKKLNGCCEDSSGKSTSENGCEDSSEKSTSEVHDDTEQEAGF